MLTRQMKIELLANEEQSQADPESGKSGLAGLDRFGLEAFPIRKATGPPPHHSTDSLLLATV